MHRCTRSPTGFPQCAGSSPGPFRGVPAPRSADTKQRLRQESHLDKLNSVEMSRRRVASLSQPHAPSDLRISSRPDFSSVPVAGSRLLCTLIHTALTRGMEQLLIGDRTHSKQPPYVMLPAISAGTRRRRWGQIHRDQGAAYRIAGQESGRG